jgi:choline-sulfatase
MKPKHILLIFTDQQRYDTVGANGNPIAQTPNLDALAKDSVVFDRAITPSPVCVPARLSMFTGQYCNRTGCHLNHKDTVYEGEGFYSQLTKAGYQSCAIGKMHHKIDSYGLMGFEKRITQEELSNPKDDYTQFIMENYPWVVDYNGMRSEMYYVPQISQLPAKDHPTAWIGDKSVEYIKNADPDRPMMLVSSFIHPHPPFNPPSPWQKLFREDPAEPFVPKQEDLDVYFDDLLGHRCSRERLDISHQDMMRQINFYYSCVSFVDYQIGRIIQALKDKGMYEDTLIVFTSDHGDLMGDYNCIGKRVMVNAACHVPCIIHYPGVEPGRRDDLFSLVDMAPTMLGYAGIPYDKAEYDGVDHFHGEKHDYVYSQFGLREKGTYMITDGVNKLVYAGKSDRYYFFEECPEEKDVYSESNPKCMEMKALLDKYIADDKGTDRNSPTDETGYTRRHPHYPGRVDHKMRKADEAAMIPEGYKIDLA